MHFVWIWSLYNKLLASLFEKPKADLYCKDCIKLSSRLRMVTNLHKGPSRDVRAKVYWSEACIELQRRKDLGWTVPFLKELNAENGEWTLKVEGMATVNQSPNSFQAKKKVPSLVIHRPHRQCEYCCREGTAQVLPPVVVHDGQVLLQCKKPEFVTKKKKGFFFFLPNVRICIS